MAWGSGENRTAGNQLYVLVAGAGSQTFPATPTGYAVLKQVQASTRASATIFGKTAVGGDDAGGVTIAASAGISWVGRLLEVSNAQSTIDQSGAQAVTSPTTPLVTTSGAVNGATDDIVLAVTGNRVTTSIAITSSQTLNNGAIATSFSDDATVSTHHGIVSFGFDTANAAADSKLQFVPR